MKWHDRRLLDLFGIETKLVKRWKGAPEKD